MDPMTIALLAGAAIKTGTGIAQSIKANKLAKSNKRPVKKIASSYDEYLNNAKAMAASSELPGQSAIEQKIGGSTASGIRSATEGASSSAGLMAAIGGLKGEEQESFTDVGIAGAQFQQANKDKLQAALLKYGGEEEELFDVNQQQPFEDTAAAAQGLAGAGMQNIMGGIEQVGGTIGTMGAKVPAGETPVPTTPFGTSSSTSRLGMTNENNALGSTNNAQKYLSAKRKGFGGSYNDWLSKQSLSTGLNFAMQ